jgi:hypothetical protein
MDALELDEGPQATAGDQLFDPPVGGMATLVVADLEGDACRPGRIDGSARVGDCERERLLDEHVLPCFSSLLDQVGVGGVWSSDEDAVDPRVVEHRVVAVERAAPVLLGERGPALR